MQNFPELDIEYVHNKSVLNSKMFSTIQNCLFQLTVNKMFLELSWSLHIYGPTSVWKSRLHSNLFLASTIQCTPLRFTTCGTSAVYDFFDVGPALNDITEPVSDLFHFYWSTRCTFSEVTDSYRYIFQNLFQISGHCVIWKFTSVKVYPDLNLLRSQDPFRAQTPNFVHNRTFTVSF